jgi:opacity protein-like surface antigen
MLSKKMRAAPGKIDSRSARGTTLIQEIDSQGSIVRISIHSFAVVIFSTASIPDIALVVGIEAEAWWSTLKTQSNLTTFGDAQKATTKNPWGADLTARIGFTFDEFLFYTKAGVAWGSFKYEFTSFGAAQSGSAFSIGLLWGFGLEYAFMPDWTLRAETNVIYFSNSDVNISCLGCGGVGPFKASISSYEILFKLGANYKLN